MGSFATTRGAEARRGLMPHTTSNPAREYWNTALGQTDSGTVVLVLPLKLKDQTSMRTGCKSCHSGHWKWGIRWEDRKVPWKLHPVCARVHQLRESSEQLCEVLVLLFQMSKRKLRQVKELAQGQIAAMNSSWFQNQVYWLQSPWPYSVDWDCFLISGKEKKTLLIRGAFVEEQLLDSY